MSEAGKRGNLIRWGSPGDGEAIASKVKESKEEESKENYIYVSDLKISNIEDYLKANYAIQMENYQVGLKLDIPKYCDDFLKEKAQETFNDALHLLNSFKKYCSFWWCKPNVTS